MATEVRSPRLSSAEVDQTQSASLCCSPFFSRRYRTTCVTTKFGLFVLFVVGTINVTGIVFMTYFNNILSALTLFYNKELYLMITAFFSFTLLMFPIAGLVGEVCYKKIQDTSPQLNSCWHNFCTSPFLYVRFIDKFIAFSSLLCLTYIIIVPRFGIFQANALQYGVDQLGFPSSKVLSSFVY